LLDALCLGRLDGLCLVALNASTAVLTTRSCSMVSKRLATDCCAFARAASSGGINKRSIV
jgi:hypothetical protein